MDKRRGTLLSGFVTMTIGLVLAVNTGAQTDSASAALHAKVDALFADWDSTTSPGCSVAVARDGKVEYARGYGMSNLEYDIAITPDSIFHVASISKQFAAFSVALLAQDGKLSLDDDIHEFVPELPKYGKAITIRHLIHHTSGLRDQWDLLGLAGWREDDLITEGDVLRIVARQRSLNFEPGSEYLYSNTGFTLLAVIVKRVSGQSLRDFAEARIFAPLDMHDTHFHDDHTMIVRRRTSAYQPRTSGGWKISIPVFDTYGATSLFTTTGDVLKWEQNFVDARVGGKTLIDAMAQTAHLSDGSDSGYGMGLAVGEYRGLRTIGHGGADAGYRADVVRFPDQNLSVVALCNASSIQPGVLTRKVAGLYLADQMTSLPSPITASANELARLAGSYWNEATDDAQVLIVKDGKLVGASGFPLLVPMGQDRFRIGESSTEVGFLSSSAGAVQGFDIVSPPRTPLHYARVSPWPSRPGASLDSRAGRYHSDELDATWSVVVKDGRLIIQSVKQPDAALDYLSGDRFVSSDVGTITFLRSGSGDVNGLTVSTGRVRRLRFDRTASSTTISGKN